MNTRVEPLRAGLAILTTLGLVIAMMMVFTGPAGAEHIDETGQVGSNCVEFQINATGTKSPPDFDGDPASENDVDITLDSWDEDKKGFTFTVSGLLVNQHVDISIKSGNDIEEPGPFGNGTHHVDNTSTHEISHIRICVFVNGVTTTTTTTVAEETTTTVADTTSTTVADTTSTTVADTTSTTVADTTTTTVEVLGTVITTSTTAPAVQVTTTVVDEVLDTQVEAEELPFTGFDNDRLVGIGVLLLASGLVVLAATGRREES